MKSELKQHKNHVAYANLHSVISDQKSTVLFVDVCLFSYKFVFTFTLHYVYFQVLVMCLAAEIVACFAWYSDELCRWKSCGGSPSLCVTDMAPPFLLSLCAADSRKKNRSEMRGENRETE